MENHMRERIMKEIEMLLEQDMTIREIAKAIKYSVGTVHKDLDERSLRFYPEAHDVIREILEQHKTSEFIKSKIKR